MKLIKLFAVFITSLVMISDAAAQADPYINILSGNGGQVNLGGNTFIEVTVGNAGPVDDIPAGKIIAQISVPGALVSIPTTGHILPSGWTIVSNSGTSIQICNSGDLIPLFEERTILINVRGDNIGGPSTIIGQLSFVTNCSTPSSINGDDNSNNSSTTSIQVCNGCVTLPVTLIDFTAKLDNCQPVLKWITESEINSDRFEIERGSINNSNWVSIGVVTANSYTTSKSEYNFIDRSVTVSSGQVLYRLKMIDKDRHFKYSGIIRVFTDCKTAQVSVYPNPVQDGRLYINLAGAVGYTEATLLSSSGQVLVKNQIYNGTNYLNTTNIADGVYILNIKDANGLDKKVKIFVQH